MKIISWNVNSIRARLEQFRKWVVSFEPDILLLQELKTTEDQFPYHDLEDLGYNMAIVGQKTYNGVGIFSKYPLEVIEKKLPFSSLEAARYIEAFTGGIRVASVYVPNGQEVGSPQFEVKLAFYKALYKHLQSLSTLHEKIIVGGDFNVAAFDEDVYDIGAMEGHLLFHEEEKKALRRLMHSGFLDIYRELNPNQKQFSWWDYRGGQFQKNEGLRVDYLLANSWAAQDITLAGIDITPRKYDKPSDHAPVWCRLNK
jgi:exodeoxyribonuclease III